MWNKIDIFSRMPKHKPHVKHMLPRERFRAMQRDLDPIHCWPWPGYRCPRGYGKCGFNGRIVPAHRAAYLTLVGPIPEGLSLDHICHNPSCVNPAHLEPVTHAENMRRKAAWNRLHPKTHCRKGHELQGENLYFNGFGRPCCCECRRQRLRNWRASKRLPNWTRLKSHCKNGHPLSGDNLGASTGGKARRCLACHRAHQKRYNDIKRAARS